MRKDWSAQLDAVTFRCTVCTYTWEARPDLVEPDADAPHHPTVPFVATTTPPAFDPARMAGVIATFLRPG